jgi:hypothetical protein
MLRCAHAVALEPQIPVSGITCRGIVAQWPYSRRIPRLI